MDTAPQRQPDYLDLLASKVDFHGGQLACSKATGIPQPTLSRKLSNKRGDFNVIDLNKILEWLGMTPQEFWDEYDHSPSA